MYLFLDSVWNCDSAKSPGPPANSCRLTIGLFPCHASQMWPYWALWPWGRHRSSTNKGETPWWSFSILIQVKMDCSLIIVLIAW